MLIWPPPLNDFHENLTRVISVTTDRQNRKEKISTDKKKNHLKILLQAVKKKKVKGKKSKEKINNFFSALI